MFVHKDKISFFRDAEDVVPYSVNFKTSTRRGIIYQTQKRPSNQRKVFVIYTLSVLLCNVKNSYRNRAKYYAHTDFKCEITHCKSYE